MRDMGWIGKRLPLQAPLPGLVVIAALASAITSVSVTAEEYPTKPVRVVLPVGAGGSSDQVIRLIGRVLGDRWKQPIVIESRPGGSGMIGAEAVAKSPPDGYTALFASTTFVQAPALFPNIPYDFARDFAPVSLAVGVTTALVVSANSPIRTLQDYLDRAQNPAKPMTYGSVGLGSSPHIYGATLAKDGKLAMAHVTYRSEPAIVADIIGDHIDSCFLSIGTAAELVKGGKLRALAATGPMRSQLLLDVRTFEEVGYPRLSISGWFGLLMPAGTSRGIVDKFARGIRDAMQQPELRQSIIDIGLQPLDSTPDQFSKFIVEDFKRWSELIRDNGIVASSH